MIYNNYDLAEFLSGVPSKELGLLILEATEAYKNCSGLVRIPDMPTLIIPDLHGRRQFLYDMMMKEIKGVSVLDLLQQNKIAVVFTGDAVHSERRGYSRWMQAERDWAAGKRVGEAIMDEVTESVNLVGMLCWLKSLAARHGSHFYHIRGNHDDVNCCAMGVYGKYTNPYESVLFGNAVQSLGGSLFNLLENYENQLPLVVYSDDLVCAHCVPDRKMDIDRLEKKTPDQFRLLAWSDNVWGRGYDLKAMDQISKGAQWVVGHRPVFTTLWEPTIEKRREQANRIIQVNAPEACMFSFKFPDRLVKTYCLHRSNVGVDVL